MLPSPKGSEGDHARGSATTAVRHSKHGARGTKLVAGFVQRHLTRIDLIAKIPGDCMPDVGCARISAVNHQSLLWIAKLNPSNKDSSTQCCMRVSNSVYFPVFWLLRQLTDWRRSGWPAESGSKPLRPHGNAREADVLTRPEMISCSHWTMVSIDTLVLV
jgi:hypothetical protein